MTWYFDLLFYENVSELVMDYDGLADPFNVKVPIGISNTYTATLWFKIELITPGANYTNYSMQAGSIASGVADYFMFTFDRALPGAKATDTLTLRVTAYTDDAYSVELCHEDLSVPFYLFDHDDLTLVDHDTFDGGTLEGWSGAVSGMLCSDQYLTAPYSYGNKNQQIGEYVGSKTFTIGAVDEAFLVVHVRNSSANDPPYIGINDLFLLPEPVFVEHALNVWNRFAFKMPTDQDVTVKLESEKTATTVPYNWYDEIWVVTYTAP